MKPSTSQLLLSAASLLPTIYAQAPQILGTGIDPLCEDVSDVTVIEYPAYFSTVYESVGTIFNFLGGTNSLVINNPPQTIITSTVLTTTVTSTTTATVTATQSASATLGAGLPAGTVTTIPSNSPIVIAYIVDAVGGRRPKGFVGSDEVTENPDDADAFYLQDGELRTLAGAKFGRNESDTYAAMVATNYDNEVTGDFFFVDGELRWISPDRGEATFYECGGNLFAGFPDAPFSNCTEATVGGISEEALNEESSTSSTSTTRGSTSSGSSSTTTTRSSTLSGSLSGGSSTSAGSSSGSSTRSSTSSGSSTSGSGSSTASDTSTTRSSTSASSGSTTVTGTASGGNGTTTSSGASTTTSAAGSTATCMDDDEEVVGGYEILCARGLVAQDLGVAAEATSFGKCIDRCTSTPLCVSISFNRNSKFCYLHSTFHLEFSNVNGEFDSAELVDTTGGSTTTSSNGASTSSTSGAQTTSTASGTGTTTGGNGATTTTTGAGATTTTPGGGSTEDCPVDELGGDYFGYSTFCGYAVDPADDNNKLNGAGEQAESFDACTMLCDVDYAPDCVGLSYFAASTTCYLFKGAHKAPAPLPGWIGAFKEGSEGPNGPGAGTTTTSAGGAASTTSAGGAATTTTSAGGAATTTTSAGGAVTTTTTEVGGATTTTTVAAATTTSASAALCPGTAPGAVIGGFEIYCGYKADSPLGAADSLSTTENVPTLEACIALCNADDDCTGLSYNNAQFICYTHKGASNPVEQVTGDFDGAVKVNGNAATTTTTNAGGATTTATTTAAAATTTGAGGGAGSGATCEVCPDDRQDLTITTVGGYTYLVYPNQAFNGNSLDTSVYDPLGPGAPNTFAQCVARCSTFDECVNATFQKVVGICYLHKTCHEEAQSPPDALYDNAERISDTCAVAKRSLKRGSGKQY